MNEEKSIEVKLLEQYHLPTDIENVMLRLSSNSYHKLSLEIYGITEQEFACRHMVLPTLKYDIDCAESLARKLHMVDVNILYFKAVDERLVRNELTEIKSRAELRRKVCQDVVDAFPNNPLSTVEARRFVRMIDYIMNGEEEEKKKEEVKPATKFYRVWYLILGEKNCGDYEGVDQYDAVNTWKKWMKRFLLAPNQYSQIRTEEIDQSRVSHERHYKHEVENE